GEPLCPLDVCGEPAKKRQIDELIHWQSKGPTNLTDVCARLAAGKELHQVGLERYVNIRFRVRKCTQLMTPELALLLAPADRQRETVAGRPTEVFTIRHLPEAAICLSEWSDSSKRSGLRLDETL